LSSLVLAIKYKNRSSSFASMFAYNTYKGSCVFKQRGPSSLSQHCFNAELYQKNPVSHWNAK